MALIGDTAKFPGQGTIYLGTEGVLLHPHGSTPMLYPRDKFTGYKYPKLEKRDHWGDFIDCCLKGGSQKPSANFDYAGPLTEAVLHGCLASAFPNENLIWDAPALKIRHHKQIGAYVEGLVSRKVHSAADILSGVCPPACRRVISCVRRAYCRSRSPC